MSAFICSPKTIGTIARRLVDKVGEDKPHASGYLESVVRDMADLNIRSVAYRYEIKKTDVVKRFTGKTTEEFFKECLEAAKKPVELEESRLLGAVGCFLYQSCEETDYERDSVYKLVAAYEGYLRHGGAVKAQGWEIE